MLSLIFSVWEVSHTELCVVGDLRQCVAHNIWDRINRGGLLLLYIFVKWNTCFHYCLLSFVPKFGVDFFFFFSCLFP